MKKSLLITTLTTALFSTSVYSAPGKGDSEAQIFGNISQQDSNTTYNVFGSYGYFVSKNAVLDVSLGVSGSSGSVGGEIYLYGVGYKHFFPSAGGTTTVPYAKLRTQAIDSDLGSTTSVDVGGGINHYLSEKTAIFYELLYQSQLDSGVKDAIQFNTGIAFYF